MVAPKLVRQFVRSVVWEFCPERVILFGSAAGDDASQDSDVDLLVVMQTDKRPVQQALEIRRRVPCSFPLDLLVKTPQEVERRVALHDFFVTTILAEGKVLYESHRQ